MRRSTIVLVAVILALTLFGCGADGEGRPPTTTIPGVTARTGVDADEGEAGEDEADEEKDEGDEKGKSRGQAKGHSKGEKPKGD